MSDRLKERIKEQLPVADYARRVGVKLVQRGRQHRGRCPFCQSSSNAPFSSTGPVWKCHACQRNGDVFDLCAHVEGRDFRDAKKHLAELAGITDDAEPSTPTDARAKTILDSVNRLVEEQERLQGEEGASLLWSRLASESGEGLDYLRKRQVEAMAHEVRFTDEQVCLALREADGRITNVMKRRFSGEGIRLLSLKGCPTSGTYGDPRKLADTTGPVIIVEGFFDWLSARVLAPDRLVLGAHSAGRLPDVARMMAEPCRERGLIFVPHKDTNKTGERHTLQAIEAARELGILEGRIRVFDVGDGCTDLNDYLVRHGPVGEPLDSAPTLVERPFDARSLITWEEPEPLLEEQRAIPPLDEAIIPEPFRPWLVDIAERTQCPLEYPTAAAIVAAASAIGRRCAIRPKRCDDWTVVPNLWGAIVGSPGVMKSAPVKEGVKPLLRIQHAAREQHKGCLADYEQRQALDQEKTRALKKEIRRLVEQGIEPVELQKELGGLTEGPPELSRYVVQDATTEKLGEILSRNPHGVLLYRDELQGWLKSLSKQGRESDRAFYLESWNGDGSFAYDRIGRGSIFIEAACVSIIGTIQPGPLREYLQGAMDDGIGADGLVQRLQIVVYPDVPKTWRLVDRWPDLEAKNRAFSIFERLVALEEHLPRVPRTDAGIPYLHFAPDAQEYFDAWLAGLERHLRKSCEHPAVIAHTAKYRSLMPSLALQFHLVAQAAGAAEFGPVSLDSAILAAQWCEALDHHARRMYGMHSRSGSPAVRLLAERIRAGHLTSGFTLRDVSRKGWSGLGRRDELIAALDQLEAMEWVEKQRVNTRGRPRHEYVINPQLAQADPFVN